MTDQEARSQALHAALHVSHEAAQIVAAEEMFHRFLTSQSEPAHGAERVKIGNN